jgi:hypothetical protein
MRARVIPAEAATPGDLVFCHSKGLVGRAIRLAERLRWRAGDTYNHVAILDHQDGTGAWTVIQAEARGVTQGAPLASVAPGGSYAIVALPAGHPISPALVVEFARDQVGRRYGFLTIASVLATILSPKFVDVMLPNTWICSALAAESLRAGGWLRNWPDIYQVSPAQLWEVLTA